MARAVTDELVPSNPVAAVGAPRAKSRFSVTDAEGVERLRAWMLDRRPARLGDATLLSLLGYVGLRPYQEPMALTWDRLRERTLLIDQTIVDGAIRPGTKTVERRVVELPAPVLADLAEWRMAGGRREGLIFPKPDGSPPAEARLGELAATLV